MDIIYPGFLNSLLDQDKNLRSGVDATAYDFAEWIGTSRVPFFPDYTDHGTEHLNAVLATCESLIAEEARQFFTAGDAAALILATLLHDSAMHISEAGFRELVHGLGSTWSVPEFRDTAWPNLWDQFIFTAKRWDDQTLARILGDRIVDGPSFSVTDPFSDYDDLGDSDRRLIGEFVRRHHHRMAHEFAVFGVPGPTVLTLSDRIGHDVWDVAGLIARSHGMPVRDALEYMSVKYHRREYREIHAIFLMTLLRVSDYLQIQSDRAPSIVFKYRHIPSAASRVEWHAHAAVTNITQTHDDPESIEIQAQPQDVETFLRLKEWLSGIQEEMDSSWAVLGEVYGSHKKLRRLALILRRVRSNLDDVDIFAKSVEYVPQRIELEVARPDLLKLLVRPLYHDIPSFGVRELVQNAVDAVRERWVLEDRPCDSAESRSDLPADVEVWLDDPDESGYAWFTIHDRGVGMTVDTVRDFFLNAGASFRHSDAWKRDFESDGSPRSKVLRSGRFGVGLLAGFLLGSRMEVATRHVRADRGIRFATTLDMDPIEIRYDPDLEPGTTIRIRVHRETHNTLTKPTQRVSIVNWFEWFVYDRPHVKCMLGKHKKLCMPNSRIDVDELVAKVRYRRLPRISDYNVFWTFDSSVPPLTVNGIFVTARSSRSGFSSEVGDYRGAVAGRCSIQHPSIIIHDSDGNFPLDLRRTDITAQRYPFEDQLVAHIVDDFLAFLIVRCPYSQLMYRWQDMPEHAGLRYMHSGSFGILDYNIHPICAASDGFALTMEHLNTDIQPACIRVMCAHSRETACTTGHDLSLCVQSVYQYGKRVSETDDKLHFAMLNLAVEISKWTSLTGSRRLLGVRAFVPKAVVNRVNTSLWNHPMFSGKDTTMSNIQDFCAFRHVERSIADVVLVASDGCPETCYSDTAIKDVSDIDCPTIEFFLEGRSSVSSRARETIVRQRWNEVIRHPVIPYDMNERQRLLAHAYRELAPLIDGHRAMLRDDVLC